MNRIITGIIVFCLILNIKASIRKSTSSINTVTTSSSSSGSTFSNYVMPSNIYQYQYNSPSLSLEKYTLPSSTHKNISIPKIPQIKMPEIKDIKFKIPTIPSIDHQIVKPSNKSLPSNSSSNSIKNSTNIILNNITEADKSQICIARLLQKGLSQLPQLLSMKPIPKFTNMTQKSVSGTLYEFYYDYPTFKARIAGTCQQWLDTMTLIQAKFTKV